MYCRLKDNYILRGWDKLPYALVNTTTGNAAFLTAKQMQALELCSGNVDLSMPFIPDDIKALISKYKSSGIIEQCRKGECLTTNQQYKKYPSSYIHSAHLAITGKCNYKCRHCYMSAPGANAYEAPHEDIMKIINQLAECGVMQVALTGGEPLLRDDFLEIADALTERGIVISQIYSNGSLITEKFLSGLERRKIHPEFVMSYDGVDGWHNWLRGVDGAEKLINRAFELCRDMGFNTHANMTIHNGNKHTLRDTINHLASLGVSSIKTAYASNVGEWTAHSDNKSIGIKNVFQTYIDYIPHYYEDGMPMDIFFTLFFAADRRTPDKYQILCYDESYNPEKTLLCPLSRSSANISPEGRVVMCGMMYGTESEKIFPAMPETHFSECINYPEHMRLCSMRASDFLKANEECRDCRFTRHCYGGCRGPAIAAEGKLTAVNRDLCELFYGGWIKKIADAVSRARPSAECPVKDPDILQ